MVVEPQSLQSLSAQELRELTTRLMTQLRHQSALLDKLTHENALLKRMKFAAQSERFNPEQKSLLEDEIEADLAAVATEIDALQQAQAPAKLEEKKVPKRAPLPANLPRREIRHEPESTTCACGCQMKRVGEDVAEKLDYVPGVFTVERHIRGKWACAKCETLTQVPVDPHIIDKGIPTTGLLAQVLVAKYADHLPLYRKRSANPSCAGDGDGVVRRRLVQRWLAAHRSRLAHPALRLSRQASSCAAAASPGRGSSASAGARRHPSDTPTDRAR
jgi:transposase